MADAVVMSGFWRAKLCLGMKVVQVQ